MLKRKKVINQYWPPSGVLNSIGGSLRFPLCLEFLTRTPADICENGHRLSTCPSIRSPAWRLFLPRVSGHGSCGPAETVWILLLSGSSVFQKTICQKHTTNTIKLVIGEDRLTQIKSYVPNYFADELKMVINLQNIWRQIKQNLTVVHTHHIQWDVPVKYLDCQELLPKWRLHW